MTDEQGLGRTGAHPGEPADIGTDDERRAAQPPAGARRTRVGAAWVAALVALVLLIFLLIFILQNLESTTVDFLGFSGSLPLALAMLFSAIGGALLVALLGAARIIQLRKATRASRPGRG